MVEKIATDPQGQLSKGEQRIAHWLKYLIDPGTVVELRAPELDTGNGFSNYPKTLSSPAFYGGYTPFSDSYLRSPSRASSTPTT